MSQKFVHNAILKKIGRDNHKLESLWVRLALSCFVFCSLFSTQLIRAQAATELYRSVGTTVTALASGNAASAAMHASVNAMHVP